MVINIASTLSNILPESAYSTHCYFIHWDDRVRRNREQACELFPVLAGIFSGALLNRHRGWVVEKFHSCDAFELVQEFRALGRNIDSTLVQLDEIEGLREAIDEGAPLIPLLSKVLSVRPSVFKHLIREKEHLIDSWWLRDPKTLLYLLDCCPPEKWPRGNEEWKQLEDTFQVLMPKHLHWMLEIIRFGIRKSMERIYRITEGLSVSDAIHNIRDVNGSISHFIHHYDGEGNPLHIFGLSIFKAAALSQKWHRQVQVEFAADAASGKQEKGLTWHSIIEEPVEVRGITFVPLNNERALVNEGVMQEHCVSTYVLDCLQGKSHIFSLRTEENEILSTLELSIDFWVDEVEIEVIQHRGKNNGPVARQQSYATKKFVEYLKSLPLSRYEEFSAAMYENMDRLSVVDGALSWPHITSERIKCVELTALIKTFGKDRLLSWGVQLDVPILT